MLLPEACLVAVAVHWRPPVFCTVQLPGVLPAPDPFFFFFAEKERFTAFGRSRMFRRLIDDLLPFSNVILTSVRQF